MRLNCVDDGSEAIAYLQGLAPFQDRELCPFPNIIITDLKMPRMDGFELLGWLQSNPACAVVPTIVFSSSFHASDVRRAYELGANSFLAKPSSLSHLTELLRLAVQFWTLCERPQPPVEGRCP